MKTLIYFFTVILIFISCQRERTVPQEVDKLIKTTTESVRPDSRTAVFDLEAGWSGDQLVVKGETNQKIACDRLLDSLQTMGYMPIDSVKRLPGAELGKDTFGLVRLSVANIRSQPKHAAELSTQALMGMILKLYKRENDWYYIQTPDGYLGWIDDDAFVPMDWMDINQWLEKEKQMVGADYSMVFREASDQSIPVSDLVSGNLLVPISMHGSFTHVLLPGGEQGYVFSDHLRQPDSISGPLDLQPTQILQTAQRFLGRPYLWGGTSGKGMDCSGFTKTVYYLHGVTIPRDASQQVRAGEVIKTDSTLKNLQPGDLVFFGRRGKSGELERVWHVAFYLGDGYILHSSGNVRIESLDPQDSLFNRERLETLVAARRYSAEVIDSDPILQTLFSSPYYKKM